MTSRSLSLSARRNDQQADEAAFNARDRRLYESIVVLRILGYLIDVVFIAVLTGIVAILLWIIGILSFGLLMPLAALVVAILPVAYHTLTIGAYGATPGMRLTGLEVRTLEDGSPPSYLQAFVMTALFYLSIGVTSWIILIVAFFNERRRLMHDFFSNLVVMRRNPPDQG
ncbi:RDD family protein [Fodinicurvata halophila]|uniref:RDD family protein n=1 Tax=Fodinicurvata halophila TaxID=1419723 RepID=A0ABV8UJJ6_9PROT